MATSVVFQDSPKGPRAELIKAMIEARLAAEAAAEAAEAARDIALAFGQRMRGAWLPSAGYPPSGTTPLAESVLRGDAWSAASDGVVDGVPFETGDTILALMDAPNSPSGWLRVPGIGSTVLAGKADIDLANVSVTALAEGVRRAGHRRGGHDVFDPIFARTLISGGDGFYRHESTVCQSANGDLHVFWQGHASSDLESAVGQRVYHAVSEDGGATWTSGVPIQFEAASNALTPTNTQSQARCIAVGDEVWLYLAHRGTSGEEALIWGRLHNGIWTWRRLLFIAGTNVPVWSASDITGAPAEGYVLTLSIEGGAATVTPTSILPRDDGGLDLLLVGVVGPFGTRHYMCLAHLDSAGAISSIGSAIPSGQDLVPAPFEGALVRDLDGSYIIHGRRLLLYAGVSGVTLMRGLRQFISESPDGGGWTAADTTGMQIHSTRSSIASLGDGRWVFAGNASWTTRNDVAIGISRDPRLFALGPLASNEDVTTHYAEYPEVLIYTWDGERRIGLSYSGRPQAAAAPCEIRWSSCPVPEGGQMLGMTTPQRGNREDMAAVSYGAAGLVVIPPRASMSWEPTPYAVERRTIRWRVTTPPGGVPYIIASVGNYQSWTQIYLVSRSGDYILKVDGQLVGMPISDPSQWQTLTIEIDKRNGVVRVMGLTKGLPKGGITVTSGDAYNLTGFSSGTAGNLIIDVAASSVAETQRLAYAAAASLDGGPNRFSNPEFSIDQVNEGGSYGNGAGYKIDGVYLSDNGGCGLTIARSSYSYGSAQVYSGGVMTHLMIQRTSPGASVPKIEFDLGDVLALAGTHVMLEFDLYDAAAAYSVDLYAVHNFGAGGSPQIETRIGNVLIDNYNTRRHAVRCFWPTVDGNAVFGEGNFTALQIRPALHAIAGSPDLRMGRLDVHNGDASRPFGREGQMAYLDRCSRNLHVLRSVDAFASYGHALAMSTTEARMVIDRPKMRAKPSLARSGSLQLAGSGGNVAVTNVTIARQTDATSELVLTVASGLTAGAHYIVRDADFATAPAQIRFSARVR